MYYTQTTLTATYVEWHGQHINHNTGDYHTIGNVYEGLSLPLMSHCKVKLNANLLIQKADMWSYKSSCSEISNQLSP